MSDGQASIDARGLGKSYRIISGARPTTLGEAVARRVRHPWERATREAFWALRDLTFSIDPGEVVGIIGRNGAGKTTLLKILSRITEPSAGEVRIRGRVGCLLEVGTGFHAELTGRENIFLNGAILGMARRDVLEQFDSIVDFSGVSKFLDVPVKRYSSGMSVRLAFAVAAHLEPEILLVDEVLAVGDAEFQRRCLGKMSEVANEDARTVLFVSHNMAAIETLCKRCIVLENGKVHFDGLPTDAIAQYLALLAPGAEGAFGDFDLTRRTDRSRWNPQILQRVRLVGGMVQYTGALQMGDGLRVVVEARGLCDTRDAYIGVELHSDQDQLLATFHAKMKPAQAVHARAPHEEMVIDLEQLPVMPGRYWLSIGVWDPNQNRLLDQVERAASFDVIPANVYGSGYAVRPHEGSLFINFQWELRPQVPSTESVPEALS